ncbi:MAG TPA: hypothetical protein PKB10_12605, partial [Tepidisphaeraceae bacterium]|nr:hypothetical protein [Tepidisphaeraceae bacterium]
DPAGTDDAILSARELAAAFQLDGFSPARRGRKRRFVGVLMLLTLVGVGVWLAMDAPRREQAIDWTQTQWTRFTQPPPAEPLFDPLVDRSTDPGPRNADPAPHDSERSPDPADPAPIAVQPTPASPPPSAEPPPTSANPVSPPPRDTASAAPGIEPDLTGLPPISQARELHRRALDAIARGDDRTALRYLEQMQSLPPNVHTGDLQSLLHLVRQRLARTN